MGRSSSSSKRKYSKKKTSSEGRRIKKSRRSKSKKIRHHDDSFSSYSDDESSSSSLYSSSSSEGEYNKSKRSRSRGRNEVKSSSKKRTRKRYSSEESSKDSPPVKKRKRSKKKADESKKKSKKIRKKKKAKRDAYTSDSESCSTCSSDEEHSPRRSRGRSGTRKNRSRSSSPSNSYFDDESNEEKMVDNNSRRLKSVITVAKPPENEDLDVLKKDELKDEIVYDYDDYPTSKSNDSNELVDRSNVPPEKSGIEVDSASGNIVSEVEDLESILRQKALENLSKFRGGHHTKPVVPVNNEHKSDKSGVKEPTSAGVSMSPVSQPVIPRSRFTWRRDPSVPIRKEEKAATSSGPHSGGSQPAAPKLPSAGLSSTRTVQNKFVNEKSKVLANINKIIGSRRNNEVKKSTVSQVENKIVNVKSQVIANTNISGVGNNEVKKLTTAQVENEIVNDKPKVMADTGNSIGDIGIGEVKNSTASRVENKNVNEKLKVMADTDNTTCSIVTSEAEKAIAGQLENKNVNEKLKVMVDTDKPISGIETSEVKMSTAVETPSSTSTKEGSSKEQRNESNDNSQFEKKTMTVMRGGEMVQEAAQTMSSTIRRIYGSSCFVHLLNDKVHATGEFEENNGVMKKEEHAYADQPAPKPQDNPNYTTWISNDAHVRMLLLSTISESAFGHVQHTTTSRDLWLALERAYAPNTISREFTLKQQLLKITMKSDETPSSY
ncbi:hypothetical protein CTI12_AA220090 [Artemisia annua]|uniref:Uncharacterized protein n=1 Tax=Artemisia annua TaxID=35608 RepID=A0A2U1NRG7_ARTAN|nr:hypothetical protein CTI12_AA220090 [Artemisia annua]